MAPLHQVHKLEQLELKLEKFIGIQKHAGKVRKLYISNLDKFLQEQGRKGNIVKYVYRKNTAMLMYVHPINRALKNTDGYGYHSSECQ